MAKRSRFKFTLLAGLFLGFLATYATDKGMQSIGVAAIAGFMTILTSYILGETKRPSIKPKVKSSKINQTMPKNRYRAY